MTLILPSLIRPSYKSGFAKSASESANPGLWKGLRHLWFPMLGITGEILHDFARGLNATAQGTSLSWHDQGVSFDDTAGNYFDVDLSGFNPSPRFCIVSCWTVTSSGAIGNKNIGLNKWDSGATQLLNRTEDTNYRDPRSIVPTSGTNFDNTVTYNFDLNGANCYALQYDDTTHVGQQFCNGSIFEQTEGSGTASAWGDNFNIFGRFDSNSSVRSLTNGAGTGVLLYDRFLTKQELDLLYQDPLAPFRRKRRIAYSVPAVEEVTTTAGILEIPSKVKPSYKSGFARSASESANPGLWPNHGAWIPEFGITGNTLRDLSGKGNHGTLQNNTAWVRSKGKQVLDFDGTGDYVAVNQMTLGTNCSVSMIFETDTTSQAWQMLCGEQSDTDNYCAMRRSVTANENYLNVQDNNSNNAHFEVPVGSWPSGTLFHLILTCENYTWRFWRDGIEYADVTGTTDTDILVDSVMGAGYTSLDLDGRVEHTMFWDHTLSPNQVYELFADPLAPFRRKRRIAYSVPAEAGGQTINLLAVTETDTAQTLTVDNPNTVTLTVTTETDTVQTLSILSPETIVLSAVTETDVSQPLTIDNPETVTLTIATETDTAQSLTVTYDQTVTLSVATETDTVQILTPSVLTDAASVVIPVSRTQVRPSYKSGFASDAATSAFPNLHKGLIAAWEPRLGNTGPVLRDVKGNNHGTLMFGAAWAVEGMNLESNKGYVDVPNHASLTITNSMSVSALVEATELKAGNSGIVSHSGTAADGWNLYLGDTGGTNVAYFGVHDGDFLSANAAGTYTLNQKFHIVGTWDGTTTRLFIDGVEVDSQATSAPMTATSTDLSIGSLYGSGVQDFEGILSGVLLYNRALTANECMQLCVDSLAPHRRGPVFIGASYVAEAQTINLVGVTETDTVQTLAALQVTVGEVGLDTEGDIVAGGGVITLTIENGADTWVTVGAAFNAIRQDIIDGMDAVASPPFGWNIQVRDKAPVTDVVRTSDTVVTITLTAQAAYDIASPENITVTIPSTALTSSIGIEAFPKIVVVAQLAVALSSVTETDTVQTLLIDNPETIVLSSVTETDTVQTLSVVAGNTVVLSSVTETDTVQTLSIDNPETVTLSSVAETDTTQTLLIDNPETITLSTATETDTVQTLLIDNPETVTLVSVTETDTVQSLGVTTDSDITLITVTETDTVQSLTVQYDQTVVLNAVTETGSVQTLSIQNPQSLVITTVTETDSAQSLSVSNPITVALSSVTEVDTVQSLTIDIGEVVTLTTVTETDTVQVLGIDNPETLVLTTVAETDTAQTLLTVDTTAELITISSISISTPKTTGTTITTPKTTSASIRIP